MNFCPLNVKTNYLLIKYNIILFSSSGGIKSQFASYKLMS